MTSAAAIRVLLVEDSPLDAVLVRAILSNVGPELACSLEHVDRLDAAVDRLAEGGIDLVLLDLNLPDSHGVSTVRRIVEADPHVSVVVLTGVDDEKTELQAMAEKADDYLVKVLLDKRQLQRALERARRPSAADGLQPKLRQHGVTDTPGIPSVLIAGCDLEALWPLNLILRSDGYQTGVTSDLASFASRPTKPDVLILNLDADFKRAGTLIDHALRIGCPTVSVVPAACLDSTQFLKRMGAQTVLSSPVCSSDLLDAVERTSGSLPSEVSKLCSV